MRTINDTIAFVFLDLAVVIVVARSVGKLFVRIGQPAVVGEIVAGLALGPALLGTFPGHLDQKLFPHDIEPYLTVLANLGLVLFMFIVGIEVDLTLVRGRERLATSVSLASVATPFGLGIGLATLLYKHHQSIGSHHVTFVAFALFIGVAMSITAFPVLARILTDRGMHRTPTGVLSLACAAVDDVLAWILLAVVVAVTVGGDASKIVEILLKTAAFAVVMFAAVRPLLRLMVARYERNGGLTSDMLAVVLVGVLLSSYTTQEIGIHFIFGAFLFGVAMPRRGAVALTHDILERLEQVSISLLLPVFFVVTGLGVAQFNAIGARGAGELALVLLVAIGGKFSGAVVAARSQRVPRRQATALGILMNTRGLTELVILQVGVQLKVLDKSMFTLLVIMAVVTTMMTSPLLRLAYPARLLQRDIDEAERVGLGLRDAYTAIVVTDQRASDDALVALACDLLGHEEPAGLVITRLLPRRASRLEVASGLGVELAQIAAAGDELRRLAALGQARGVSCSVHSGLGDDRLADVVALAVRSNADLIVAYADWVTARQEPGVGHPTPDWPRDLAATVVLVPAQPAAISDADPTSPTDPTNPAGLPATATGPVVAVLDGSGDSPAVLRLAVQTSLRQGTSLALTGAGGTRADRRANAAGDALRRAGIAASTVKLDAAAPAGRVFAAIGSQLTSPDVATVIRVRGGSRDADRELDEIAARITVEHARG